MSKYINLKESLPSYPSGIYLFKCADGQTKFGVAKNFADRWQHREYTTRLIEAVWTWDVSPEEMFDVESQIRNQFRNHIREGARDYLIGDHFDDIKSYVNSLLGKSNTAPKVVPQRSINYGLDALVEYFGIR